MLDFFLLSIMTIPQPINCKSHSPRLFTFFLAAVYICLRKHNWPRAVDNIIELLPAVLNLICYRIIYDLASGAATVSVTCAHTAAQWHCHISVNRLASRREMMPISLMNFGSRKRNSGNNNNNNNEMCCECFKLP